MGTKKKYPEPYKRDGSDTYYFMYVGKDSKRKRQSTGENRKERAREIIREIMDRMASDTSELTFAAYAQPYFLEDTCPHFARLRQEGHSIGLQHLSQIRSLLDKHILTDQVFSNIPISMIKRGDILDLRKRLVARKIGLNTLNKCISTVKTVLSEASFRGDIDTNPGSAVGEIKYKKMERGILTPPEISSLLAYLRDRSVSASTHAVNATPVRPGAKRSQKAMNALQMVRDEALIAFLFCTGTRAGEIRALRWSAIDMQSGHCRIDEAVKGLDGIGLPKWGKTREIVLTPSVLERLKRWKASLSFDVPDDYFVFGTLDGKPLGYTGLSDALEKALTDAKEAKVLPTDDRWISCHAARHSLNTNLLAAGVAPLLVQSFLGWSSAESRILTKVQSAYTHLELLRVEDVAQEIERMYSKPDAEAAKKLS